MIFDKVYFDTLLLNKCCYIKWRSKQVNLKVSEKDYKKN